MFARIAAFELRYQLRQPTFWVVTILFALLSFGVMAASDNIRVGGTGGNVYVNAASSIIIVHCVLNLFFLLGAVGLVANAVSRDTTTGYGPLINATPITRFDYVLGRFAGSFLAAALAYSSISIGLMFGSFMPWIDPETLQGLRLGDYLYAYLVFGLPGVFFTSAVVFSLATLTRSMMASYVGAVGLIILYFVVTSTLLSKPEMRALGSWLEPLGIGAFTEISRYWTPAQKNTELPALTGVLLGNRLLWTAVGMAFLASAVAFYSRAVAPKRNRPSCKRPRKSPLPTPRRPVLWPAAATALHSPSHSSSPARALKWL